MKPMRIIKAEGLGLLPQTVEHAAEMFELLCDPAIYRFENEAPVSLEWLSTRFSRLESGCSADGPEQWFNWVVALPSGELTGYVQATLTADARADIAYVFASRYWGRGLARTAVAAMMAELSQHHGTQTFEAEFKRDNQRSQHLLSSLGFTRVSDAVLASRGVAADEWLMTRPAAR